VQASETFRLPPGGAAVRRGVRKAPSPEVPPVLRQAVEAIAEAPATTFSPGLGQVLQTLAEATTVKRFGTVTTHFQASTEPPDVCLVSNGLVRGLLVGLDVHDGWLLSLS